jgi:predicted nucleic acid-binding protein
MDQWVIVDPCVWISFFGKLNSLENEVVGKLLETDRVALIGPIVAEVLMGLRRKDQADWVASRLKVVHYIDLNRDDWQTAADLGRDLASKGKKLRLTDLAVVAIARRCDCFVYSTDPHFDLFHDLKRFRPE